MMQLVGYLDHSSNVVTEGYCKKSGMYLVLIQWICLNFTLQFANHLFCEGAR